MDKDAIRVAIKNLKKPYRQYFEKTGFRFGYDDLYTLSASAFSFFKLLSKEVGYSEAVGGNGVTMGKLENVLDEVISIGKACLK